MTAIRLIPPDGTDWTIDAVNTSEGVELAIAFMVQGKPITARFAMDRSEARTLAAGILKAAGDATMRTFPKPVEAFDG